MDNISISSNGQTIQDVELMPLNAGPVAKFSFSIDRLFSKSKAAVTNKHVVNPPYSKASPDNNVPINLPKALDI